MTENMPEYAQYNHTIESWTALTESQRNTLRAERQSEIAKQRREQTRLEIERIKRESDERAEKTRNELLQAKRDRIAEQLKVTFLSKGGSPETWEKVKDETVDRYLLDEATAEVTADRNAMRVTIKGMF